MRWLNSPELTIPVVMTAGLVACGGPDRAEPSTIEPTVNGWSISEPVLTIGHEGVPEYEFENIIGLGRLTSGRWVVFDRGSHGLRFYDADGKYVRSAGRRGGGPGEFFDVFYMEVVDGHAIYTYDQQLRRLTQWDSAGTVRYTVNVFVPATGSVLNAIGLVDERTFLWMNFTTPQCVEAKVTIDSVTYYAFDLRARLRRRMEVSASVLQPVVTTTGGSRWGSSLNVISRCLPQVIPFAPGPLHATSHRQLIIAQRAGVRIIRYDFDEGRASTITIPIARRALTRASIEAYVRRAIGTPARDEMGRPLPAGPGMDLYAKRLRELPYPDSTPAVDQLEIDALGYIWIREYSLTADTIANWNVLAPEGEIVARLQLPAALRIFDIGPDYLAGVERDSFDIQRVVVRTLARDAHTR